MIQRVVLEGSVQCEREVNGVDRVTLVGEAEFQLHQALKEFVGLGPVRITIEVVRA